MQGDRFPDTTLHDAVVDSNHEEIFFAPLDFRCDIHDKGDIPALWAEIMLADIDSIQPHPGDFVNRAEMQFCGIGLAFGGRNEGDSVPGDAVIPVQALLFPAADFDRLPALSS